VICDLRHEGAAGWEEWGERDNASLDADGRLEGCAALGPAYMYCTCAACSRSQSQSQSQSQSVTISHHAQTARTIPSQVESQSQLQEAMMLTHGKPTSLDFSTDWIDRSGAAAGAEVGVGVGVGVGVKRENDSDTVRLE
jgi:hypothetical protein